MKYETSKSSLASAASTRSYEVSTRFWLTMSVYDCW